MLNENQRQFLILPIVIGLLVLAVLGAAWYYGDIPFSEYIFTNWNVLLVFGIGMIAVPAFVLWNFKAFKGVIFAIIAAGFLYLFGLAATGNPDAEFISGALVYAAVLSSFGFVLELHHQAQQNNPNYNTLLNAVVTSFILPTGFAIGGGLLWGILVSVLEWSLYVGAVFLFRKAKENISNTFKK